MHKKCERFILEKSSLPPMFIGFRGFKRRCWPVTAAAIFLHFFA